MDRWNARRVTAIQPELIGRIASMRAAGINLSGIRSFPIEQYVEQVPPPLHNDAMVTSRLCGCQFSSGRLRGRSKTGRSARTRGALHDSQLVELLDERHLQGR